ncbi:MAG: alpha-xylosidase, partial [Clostridia bacterium]|nr:alpha-xylosidase [Clostridia bacterium]
QYMLGESMLVAPIFNEDGMASYYLPKGIWTNFLTGEKVAGGQWLEEEHGYMSIPLLVRQNSIIAVGNQEDQPDYDYADNVEFHVFELQDGCEASTVVYNTSGEQEMTAKAVRKGDHIEFSVTGAEKPWRIVLRGIKEIFSVDRGVKEPGEKGMTIIPEKDSFTVNISL